MSTLRAARQTYKDTGATTDAWFIRIERQDGTIIRITNAAENVQMSTRVLADATTEAIGSTVTYYSASGYNPTAVSKQTGLNPGTVDLEGLLDAVTATGSGSETRQYTPSEVTASDGTDISGIIDGSTTGGSWTSPLGANDHNNPAWARFDFKQPVSINRIKVYTPNNSHRLSVLKSDDGQRFDEVTPPILYDATGSIGSFAPDIPLPYMLRSRYIQLQSSGRITDMREVEFYKDLTPSTSGTIARVDIENNLYDNAKVFIFLADYTDPYEDDEKISSGYLTDIQLRDGTYVAQFMSKIDVLSNRVGRVRTPGCDTTFGSFRCGVHLDPHDWVDNIYTYAKSDHDASSGTWVKPTTPNGYYYFATNSAMNGSSEPTWPTTPGATVVDGSVTWQTVRANKISAAIDVVSDSRFMTVTGISGDANGVWNGGIIEFTSGDLVGVKSTIFGQIGSLLRLAQPLKNLPASADTVILTKGCQKRFTEDCKGDFDNSRNFQGSLYIPGKKVANKAGNS